MKNLIFRAPGRPATLGELLGRALPAFHPRQVAEMLRDGDVRVAKVVTRKETDKVWPGSLVEATVRGATSGAHGRAVPILERGHDYVVVDKPAGLPSHEATPGALSAIDLVADELGLNRDGLWPVHRLDADVSGVWLLALTRERAAKLSGVFAQREVVKQYQALVPALPWPDGMFDGHLEGKKARTRYREIERRGEIAAIELDLQTGRHHQLRQHLANAGAAILGDSLYGGVMVAGGLRLRATRLALAAHGIEVEVSLPDGWWPTEPAFPPVTGGHTLLVSEATRQATERGHPWVLTDTETSDAGAFRPGTVVSVKDTRGVSCGLARIEGTGRVAARMWSKGRDKVSRALAERSELRVPTDAVRLIHGEADGLPGLFVERFGEALRVLVSGASALGLVEATVDAIRSELGRQGVAISAVVLVTHLPGAPSGEHRQVRLIDGELAGGRKAVSEGDLRFVVDLGLDEPFRSTPGTGLFLDQRANRARVKELAGGGRWLNLFCHTGSFSVAALAAGAREVVSVDLSGPYLRWLDENLSVNDLPAGSKHVGVKGDVRRYLDRLEAHDCFDGIILDPPTAAAAGRKFWSVRRDGPQLVASALRHLSPGGVLLLCRNDRKARGQLGELARGVAAETGIALSSVEDAPADVDFPTLSGFTEGDPFEGVWVRRSAR